MTPRQQELLRAFADFNSAAVCDCGEHSRTNGTFVIVSATSIRPQSVTAENASAGFRFAALSPLQFGRSL